MTGVRAELRGGDRRSIGASDRVVAQILDVGAAHAPLLADIIAGLMDVDAVVRLRCGDVAEKISRQQPLWLLPHKRLLLELADEAKDQELRWHLAQTLPRLTLAASERARMFRCLETYRRDQSRIVRVCALQGLFDLALQDDSLQPLVCRHVETALRAGSPAEKARARKLAMTCAQWPVPALVRAKRNR